MKKRILLFISLISSLTAMANSGDSTTVVNKILNPVEGLKISGYIQTQWQLAQTEGQLGVTDSYDFPTYSDNTFSIRRARLKFDYEYKNFSAMVQFDVGQSKVGFKDAYVAYTSNDKVFSTKMGVFALPFGNEIGYSSSKREAPERSRMYLTLFPDMRDLGVEVALTGKQNTFFDKFNLNLAIGNVNSTKVETDSRKNFVGHLTYKEKIGRFDLGLGTSFYLGGVLNTNNSNMVFNPTTMVYDEYTDVRGTYSPRTYYGFDAQLSANWGWGTSTLKGEYIGGTQQGTKIDSESLTELSQYSLYERKFNAASVYYIQSFAKSPISLSARFDYYDPNRDINSTELNSLSSVTDLGDIAFTSVGGGVIYQINKAFRLMLFYEKVWNETAAHIVSYDPENNVNYDYSVDAKDNLLTIRAQIKF